MNNPFPKLTPEMTAKDMAKVIHQLIKDNPKLQYLLDEYPFPECISEQEKIKLYKKQMLAIYSGESHAK